MVTWEKLSVVIVALSCDMALRRSVLRFTSFTLFFITNWIYIQFLSSKLNAVWSGIGIWQSHNLWYIEQQTVNAPMVGSLAEEVWPCHGIMVSLSVLKWIKSKVGWSSLQIFMLDKVMLKYCSSQQYNESVLELIFAMD